MTAKGVLNRYQPAMLGGDHQLSVGAQVERGEHHQPAVIPGGVRFVDSSGQPFQAVSRAPSISGGRFNALAVFASDSVTVKDRVTVNAGLRFDHSDAISQGVPALDAAGLETDDIVSGLGEAVHVERGVAASGRDGQAQRGRPDDAARELRAIQSGCADGRAEPDSPRRDLDHDDGVQCGDRRLHNPRVGGRSEDQPRARSQHRPPRTDEYSVGLDREITPRLAAAVAYIRKNGSDFIAWTDVGGQYREETRTLADGRSLPVFVLTNSTAARRFLLTNPDDYSLTYNGLVIALDKRRSNGWQAFGSYTFSRTSGLQASSGAAADGCAAQHDRPEQHVRTRSEQPDEREGRLPNDRPHIFRVMGTVEVPRTGFVVAANLQHFSGKPWAATDAGVAAAGRSAHPARAARFAPALVAIAARRARVEDARIGAGRVELLLDVLNLLNDTAEEALATDNLFSPNFGRPTVFMDPAARHGQRAAEPGPVIWLGNRVVSSWG